MNERVKYPIIMTIICLISAAALAFTFALTKDNISASKKSELVKGLEAVLPAGKAKIDERPLAGVTAAQPGDADKLYVALDDAGNEIGYAAIGSARGYSSEISAMVGVTPDLKIIAVRILSQSETPGLGERTREVPPTKSLWSAIGQMFAAKQAAVPETALVEPPFQAQFRNKSVSQLTVTKIPGSKEGISAITGATITTQAVVDAVRNGMQVIEKTIRPSQTAGQ